MTARSVIIVGAGRRRCCFAYLLARRGVNVRLLEKHPDFTRTFRGEGLQPSGVEALAQMGLAEQFDRLPHAIVDRLEIYRNGTLRASIPTDKSGFVSRFVSQPAMLRMLTDEAKRHRPSAWRWASRLASCCCENGRVVGVRADGPNGPREFRADLVVGTDGRHSITRKQGQFTELETKQGFDVLWAKVPFPGFWPDRRTVRHGTGRRSASPPRFPSATAACKQASPSPRAGSSTCVPRASRRGPRS